MGKATLGRAAPFVFVVVLLAGAFTAERANPVEHLGPIRPVAATDGGFEPLDPSRLLDTRDGTGAPAGKLDSGQSLTLDVTGVGGVPDTGVAAVALNITVTGPTRESHLRVHPSGTPLPLAASLNWEAGQTTANFVIAKVGADGNIVLYNDNGNSHFVADVAGWFPTGSDYSALDPNRILDTRNGTGAPAGKVGAGESLTLDVTGVGGVPASGVGAVVVNITVTAPTTDSHLRVHPSGTPLPLAASLNWEAGQTIPNLVIAKVGADGDIVLYNHNGNSHFVADVAGWFPTGTDQFTPLDPSRLLDTRNGTGAPAAALGPGESLTLDVTGVGGIPDAGVGAVALNITVTGPTKDSHLRVHDSGALLPLASSLNWEAGQTIPNLVITKVGEDGDIVLYNHNGRSHFVADVAGWFPATPSTTRLFDPDASAHPFPILSENAELSDDGRFAVFETSAETLVDDDTDDVGDVYLRDRLAGTTTRVSVDARQSIGEAEFSTISGDGQHILFVIELFPLTPDLPFLQFTTELYAYDRLANSIERVTGPTDDIGVFGGVGDDFALNAAPPSISDDGRYIAFVSGRDDLVAGDTNGSKDLFVLDRDAGTIERVNLSTGGSVSSAEPSDAVLSGDGTHIAFVSSATNLVPGEESGTPHVYVRDLGASTTELIGPGTSPAIADDGSHVAFESSAALDPNDADAGTDIYLYDGSTFTLVTVATGGGSGNGESSDPALDGPGSTVAFRSAATDLVAGDNDGAVDTFVRDVGAGTTELVASATSFCCLGNGDVPSLDDSGALVAFASDSSSLVADDTNESDDVFVLDRDTESVERLNVSSTGDEGFQYYGDWDHEPDLSADGRWLAFKSSASGLVPDEIPSGVTPVYLHDLVTGTTVVASRDPAGAIVTGADPSISADGRYVAFQTEDRRAWVRDRVAGTTTLVSVSSGGAPVELLFDSETSISADGDRVLFRTSDDVLHLRDIAAGQTFDLPISTDSYHATDLSGDGSTVVFATRTDGLVPGDTNGDSDLFSYRIDTGETTLVSARPDGAPGNGFSGAGGLTSGGPHVSQDGRFVTFASIASDLVPGDVGDRFSSQDVFVRDMETGTTTRVSEAFGGGQADDASEPVDISPDGVHIVLVSVAKNLVAGGTNGDAHVFVWNRLNGTTRVVSVASDGTFGNGLSFDGTISGDGATIAFTSRASNLVASDDNYIEDLFLRDLD